MAQCSPTPTVPNVFALFLAMLGDQFWQGRGNPCKVLGLNLVGHMQGENLIIFSLCCPTPTFFFLSKHATRQGDGSGTGAGVLDVQVCSFASQGPLSTAGSSS